MAGHSQFANIKHRKGAQDKKKANRFTKLARELVVAAREGGPDPNYNPRLRAAMIAARKDNVPKDKIEAAIKKGSSPAGGENYDEMRYEGYAPGGVALIIEVLTDNRNRSASDIRSLLTKFGGNLGETGSVNFMFERVGIVHYPVTVAAADPMFEAALEAGASECESGEGGHEVTTAPEDLNAVREALAKKFGDAEASRLIWKPKDLIPVQDKDHIQKIVRILDGLEELDDVQHVYANYDIAEDALRAAEEALKT